MTEAATRGRSPVQKRWIVWLALLASASALALAFVYLQRYTELGVLVLGGDRYWVRQAQQADDTDRVDACLRRVLAATQYGVNAAQNEVNALSDARARLLLFERLVVLAPNERWQRIYAADAERQRPLLGARTTS